MNEFYEKVGLRLSTFYNRNKFAGRVDRMKFILMPFVFFAVLGFPMDNVIGEYVSAICNFAALSFFIFCGFFTLVPDKKERKQKLGRAVKRSFIFFGIVFVAYLLINVIYLAANGNIGYLVSPELLRSGVLFNFIVLNVWPFPIGSAIWFIESLAFSYLFFFLAEKLNLSKLYLPLAIVLFIFSLLSGELARLIDFSFFGRTYIPGGMLTKALPFMLVGMFLRKTIDKIGEIHKAVFFVAIFFGIGFSVLERLFLGKYGLLVYTGNAVGYAIIAIAVCCLSLRYPEIDGVFLDDEGADFSRNMYALCQPVSLAVWAITGAVAPDMLSTVSMFGSVICFILCFGLAFIIGSVKFRIRESKGALK